MGQKLNLIFRLEGYEQDHLFIFIFEQSLVVAAKQYLLLLLMIASKYASKSVSVYGQ